MVTKSKAAWYVANYRGWEIYCIREGFQQKPIMRMIPLFVAIQSYDHKIMLGVDLSDLYADIIEAML